MPVHAEAGFSALASILVIGKRRYTCGGRTRPSNIPLVDWARQGKPGMVSGISGLPNETGK